eukprot:359319-Chlamydomonas_euryale.AAC.1
MPFAVPIWRLAIFTGSTLLRRDCSRLAAYMRRGRVDICCVQELRKPGTGDKQLPFGSRMLYSGGSTRTAGASMLLTPRAWRATIAWGPWPTERDHILVVHLLSPSGLLCIVVMYAPTNAAGGQHNDEFYGQLANAVRAAPAHSTLVLLGDLNAKVDAKVDEWPGVFDGPHTHLPTGAPLLADDGGGRGQGGRSAGGCGDGGGRGGGGGGGGGGSSGSSGPWQPALGRARRGPAEGGTGGEGRAQRQWRLRAHPLP